MHGQPVLVDFERSILSRPDFVARGGASPLPRSSLLARLKQVIRGENKSAKRVSRTFVQQLGSKGRVLVIGGGAVGSGASELYGGCEVIGTDIYASENTQFIADAHDLPFADGVFDGVWIQAVLEHVLDPTRVVSEIYRVLRDGGLVFADTPFLQQVHEGAYDFTRFTLSGQRWLFRRFELIEVGITGGAGTSLLWALRGFIRAVTGSSALAKLSVAAFGWLRLFDGRSSFHEDAASGTFFFGRKGVGQVAPVEMVQFYKDRPGRT
jgi:SAM-dependent methyltransferase